MNMNDIGLDGIAAFTTLVKSTKTLVTLALGGFRECSEMEDMMALADALAENTSVKDFTLQGCRVQEFAAVAFGNVLKKNATLEKFSLRCNSLKNIINI